MRRLLLAAGLLLAPAARGAEAVTVVRARLLFHADGRSAADAVVVIRGGRIEAAGANVAVPAGEVRLLEAPVACPGFVDLWTRAPGGQDAEEPRPFAPALLAADGLDPLEEPALAAAREGILRRVLLPSDRNPMGGRAAILALSPGAGMLRVAVPVAGGTLSLAGAAARRERHPGSLAGIVRGIESALDDAAGVRAPFSGADPALGLGDADRAALRDLLAGKAPAFLFARSRPEVRSALALAGSRRLRPVLVDPRCGAGPILDGAAAAGIAPADLSVVLALDPEDPRFHLESATALAKAGVRVGFGSGGPGRGPDVLRLMAGLARRHGLPAEAARDALLGRGFGDLGRSPSGLAPGDPADLVLLDGDPSDPASRVLRVLVGGAER